jgi:hypothetical protein
MLNEGEMSAVTPSLLLDRLAASLGCSPEVFFGQNPNELSEMLELLTLWMATKDKLHRRWILEVLRAGVSGTAASDEGLAHAMRPPNRGP